MKIKNANLITTVGLSYIAARALQARLTDTAIPVLLAGIPEDENQPDFFREMIQKQSAVYKRTAEAFARPLLEWLDAQLQGPSWAGVALVQIDSDTIFGSWEVGELEPTEVAKLCADRNLSGPLTEALAVDHPDVHALAARQLALILDPCSVANMLHVQAPVKLAENPEHERDIRLQMAMLTNALKLIDLALPNLDESLLGGPIKTKLAIEADAGDIYQLARDCVTVSASPGLRSLLAQATIS